MATTRIPVAGRGGRAPSSVRAPAAGATGATRASAPGRGGRAPTAVRAGGQARVSTVRSGGGSGD